MSDGEGFFSRWSRRKTQRRAGDTPPVGPPVGPAPAAPASNASHPPAAVSTPLGGAPQFAGPPSTATPRADCEAHAVPVLPPPTLADVAQLTPTSDFSRFVDSGVEPSVQHAALKKLFSDPHFNVMDGLDTYIDDYNTPNPIPDAMRRRLQAHAAQHVLHTPAAADAPAFRIDTGTGAGTGAAAEALPDGAAAPALPQSPTPRDIEPSRTGTESDEDIALRLQPDDAADTAGKGADRRGSRA